MLKDDVEILTKDMLGNEKMYYFMNYDESLFYVNVLYYLVQK